ncbi:hypothetical protein [Thalassorhabdomicrobium marinisediminis]|uniref:hypothetical protein n=1 Tax=Thalassorhabdomicrobium marinisediminis TaxID=2170577 RepID=UPI0024927C44|nr:hypothetical protein [Thalassorhabdomicrobium marinisediminis]
MKAFALLGVGIVTLAACAPQVPDSGAGVGFGDYAQYEVERAQREAALRGVEPPAAQAIVPPTATSAPTAQSQDDGGVTSADLAAAGINTQAAASPTPAVTPSPAATASATAGATAPAAPVGSNPQISDEQDFEAVTDRESIESDAERRARMAAAYQVLEAEALPVRNGQVEPNIVQYALQAPNEKGQPVFSRSIFSTEGRFARNCAKYRTADEAQRDFLVRGGPQRDRLGLDPDGDGFACGWDPQAFRTVVRN